MTAKESRNEKIRAQQEQIKRNKTMVEKTRYTIGQVSVCPLGTKNPYTAMAVDGDRRHLILLLFWQMFHCSKLKLAVKEIEIDGNVYELWKTSPTPAKQITAQDVDWRGLSIDGKYCLNADGSKK
jgi:hypothetical protein